MLRFAHPFGEAAQPRKKHAGAAPVLIRFESTTIEAIRAISHSFNAYCFSK